MAAIPEISVVVPLFNESTVVVELYERLTRVLSDLNRSYELIFVDDGSSDDTFTKSKTLQEQDSHVILIKLRSNFGQTASLAAGVDAASGDIIIPMDGDLQHAPEDIPLLLNKIDEGYDIASGWRKKRVDNFLIRRLPSWIANRLMRSLSGIALHDFGTTFKAYRADVIKPLKLYGQFHRFIPVLANARMKVKICEVPIQNIVRPHGVSNYTIKRTFTVFFDLIRLKFLTSYLTRPLQVFGAIGLGVSSLGVLIFSFLFASRYIFDIGISFYGIPLFIVSVFLMGIGIQFISIGLLGEMTIRLHYDAGHKKDYVVENIFTGIQKGELSNEATSLIKPETTSL
jgi:glycosyltransferase involved in cell wall biosynthesis